MPSTRTEAFSTCAAAGTTHWLSAPKSTKPITNLFLLSLIALFLSDF